jgi:hypothetical protein
MTMVILDNVGMGEELAKKKHSELFLEQIVHLFQDCFDGVDVTQETHLENYANKVFSRKIS